MLNAHYSLLITYLFGLSLQNRTREIKSFIFYLNFNHKDNTNAKVTKFTTELNSFVFKKLKNRVHNHNRYH